MFILTGLPRLLEACNDAYVMAKINRNYNKLQASYLFSDIAKRVKAFQEENPEVEVLKLGIGNTTEALPESVVEGLKLGVEKLSKVETYTGYGDEQGDSRLRQAIADWYSKRGISLDSKEVFVSDGAKSDSANIQSIFSDDAKIALTDPAYPVYVDSNVISGKTGEFKDGRYEGLVYMVCNSNNQFVPDIPKEKADLIYICSPNNPTGAVLNHEQLKAFVDYAQKNKAIIIFDAAYSEFIQDKSLPRSIYEINGAKKCAIEIQSFSKMAGFTGVRLGWTIVPMELQVEDSEPGELNSLWNRRQTTMFNGASNISQEGGMAYFSERGLAESKRLIDYYMENARIIRQGMEGLGLKVFGGDNAPYIWLKCPNNLSSWEFFDKLLNEAKVVCTPGVGFGPSGEGYVRLSAFGHRENIEKAVESIKKNLELK